MHMCIATGSQLQAPDRFRYAALRYCLMPKELDESTTACGMNRDHNAVSNATSL